MYKENYNIYFTIKNRSKTMKKIDGDVIAAIIFLLCLLVILATILFVFWVKISPWLTISLVTIIVFLIMNCKQRLNYDKRREYTKES